jgi:hypothetical protein
MIDITPKIKAAISTNVLWSISLFFECIEQLQNTFTVSHWQDEENWAGISSGEETVGYLWRKYPLLFIKEEYSTDIKALLSQYSYIEVIEVNSLTEPIFKANHVTFKDILEPGVNYDAFSAEDLWFHTNSI